MSRGLDARGYGAYRITDAATMRLLLAGPLSIGRLAAALGVTRQAARKLISGLEERKLASTSADPDDARKLNVVLTAVGRDYATQVVEVIGVLNAQVARDVSASALATADRVLRTAITDTELRQAADRIPRPIARRSPRSTR